MGARMARRIPSCACGCLGALAIRIPESQGAGPGNAGNERLSLNGKILIPAATRGGSDKLFRALSSVTQASIVSWLRRVGFMPPREPEPTSEEHLRRLSALVLQICAAAVVFDIAIYFGLKNVPMLSERALFAFAVCNVCGLSFTGLMIHVTQIRAPRPRAGAWPFMCVIMGLTTVVWIQLTGVVTSYFIMAAAVLIVLYRWGLGWASGLSTYLTTLLGHVAAYLLEEASVLPRMSIMRDAGFGLDAIPAYRLVAMTSIVFCYTGAYAGACIVVSRLRAQRRELERVRREMIGLIDGARQGRLSGTELGRWFVDELLGRGGAGEVYAAHDEHGTQVAIKVLYPHLADDPRAFQRFVREQEVGAEISGTYFPKLIEVGRAEDASPYIAMERLRGEDLGALLRRRGALSIDETLRLARALANALDELHQRGIVHRDLTPGNVFLVASSDASWPDLRVLDLGMCKLRDSEAVLTQSSMVMGTPGYMAPEQIWGQAANAGPECDVFAFGSIVYRALTGEPAFDATTLVQAIDSVCRRDPIWPSVHRAELGPAVDAVFQKALAKQPEHRFSSAGAFAQALVAACAR
jgi:serine/threonine-protein kinase